MQSAVCHKITQKKAATQYRAAALLIYISVTQSGLMLILFEAPSNDVATVL